MFSTPASAPLRRLCFWTTIVLCFVLKKHGDLLYSYSPYLRAINITSSGVAADEGKGLQSGGLVTQTIIQTGSVLILSMTPHRLLSDPLRKRETGSGMPASVGMHHYSRAGASQRLNKQIRWMFSLYLFVFHRNSPPHSNNGYHFTLIIMHTTILLYWSDQPTAVLFRDSGEDVLLLARSGKHVCLCVF